jgi:hypothetical protein
VLIGIILANVLLLAVLASLWLLIRDVRRLHRSGKSITDAPGDAAGVSPAGMLWQDNLGSH